MNIFRTNLASLDNLVRFYDRNLRSRCHDGVEVESGAFEDTVAHLVSFLRLDPGVVRGLEGFFENERFATELADLGFLAEFQHFWVVVLVVQRWQFT